MGTNRTAATAEAQGIDWGAVEGGNTEFATKYPRMQWVHGSKQAAGFMKGGGLFISKEEFPNFHAEGFEETTFITREGDEIEGYGANAAKLAVIRVKHQWVKDRDDPNKNVPLAHVLCVVKGSDEPVCISLKGPSKSLDFQKAFNQHIGQNVSVANRTRPNGAAAIEPFALWFPLISGPHHLVGAKGGGQQSSVTSPELSAPEKIDRDYVATLWVGAENYRRFASIYKETTEWQKQPIWEQRGEDSDRGAPEFSGPQSTVDEPADRATPQQMDFIGGIIEAKKMSAEDVKQMCLTVSDSAASTLRMLSRSEAAQVVDYFQKQS